MAQVFLSYSRNDGNEFVAEVQRELEARGYYTWRDVRNLHPDQDFTADIEAGIAESSHVVVCVTQDTKRNNSFVRREIQYALAVKKPVIPLRCHDTVPHISIINNEWVDYFRDKVQAVQRLTEILNDRRLQNEPGDQPEDPFRPYLEAALQSIVTGLQQRIIRQIDLRSKATPDAVNVPERKAPAKQMDIFQLAMSGVKMGGDVEPEKAEAKTDFETFAGAFEYYHHRVLLMGEPGAGKTITLMAYAREAYAARLEDPTRPLPLFGLIPTWNPETQPPLAEWLAETYGLDKAAVQHEVEQGRALLLLDGLDELGREREIRDKDENVIERYDPRLRFIKALPSNNQILMTSRIEDYNDVVERGEKAALDGAITLQPLTEKQMAAYLADQPELWQLIQSDTQLREITTTPLLMSLFAFAYQDMSAEERRQLTELQNALDLRDRIFLGYIEKRYEHERRKINADLPFSYETMLDLLGKLAIRNAASTAAEANVLNLHDLESLFLRGSRLSDFIALTTRLHILIPTGSNSFRFVHLLLRNGLVYRQSLPALKDLIADVRSWACFALEELGDERVVEPLIAALNDEDRSVRWGASEVLGKIGDMRAVEPLIAALKDKDVAVRCSAAEALGKIGDMRAIEPLIAAMNDEIGAVRASAAEALEKFGNTAVESLISGLQSEDSFVRWRIVDVLGKIGDIRAVEPLITVLNDKSSLVRTIVAEVLGKLGDARAVEPLITALHNEDFSVRMRASELLGKIGDARAVEPLMAALKDSDADVQWRAARVLEQIGTLEALIAVEEWQKRLRASYQENAGGSSGNADQTPPPE
jgi:HEAT repeat protein